MGAVASTSQMCIGGGRSIATPHMPRRLYWIHLAVKLNDGASENSAASVASYARDGRNRTPPRSTHTGCFERTDSTASSEAAAGAPDRARSTASSTVLPNAASVTAAIDAGSAARTAGDTHTIADTMMGT